MKLSHDEERALMFLFLFATALVVRIAINNF